MIHAAGGSKNKNIPWVKGKISRADRQKRYGHRPMVLWLTGLSASGKSTIAVELEKRFFQYKKHTYILDGDNVRRTLSSDLDFSPDGRVENIRRATEVAKLFYDAGFMVITAFISPYASGREIARDIIGKDDFVEVYLECPIEVCESRDPKGLYKKAKAGEIDNFTGVSAPYEVPRAPHIKVPTHKLDIDGSVEIVLTYLRENDFL